MNRTADEPGADSAAAAPQIQAPSITLPKGGGAIRGIGEMFAANPVTGTASMSVPVTTSPGRSGFGPQLSLSYDSGVGNGPFGLGWSPSLPSITRKTDKGLPRYADTDESDAFVLSGAEDLVPVPRENGGLDDLTTAPGYAIRRYRPRIETLFARIERWTSQGDTADVHWRSISKDNVLTVYGRDPNSRIADPANPARVFSWLICETRDDKGNAIIYQYKPEDVKGIDLAQAHERHRGEPNAQGRTANRYLKRIWYGNRTPLLDNSGNRPTWLPPGQLPAVDGDREGLVRKWMFEVVFDYGEHDPDIPTPGDTGLWSCRDDPFSSYRPGFEVRTRRLCRRVLMFHHFPAEPSARTGCLVRSTDFGYQPSPVATVLSKVTHCGYRRTNSGYLKRSMPAVEFTYSQPVICTEIRDVARAGLPAGVDGAVYQWVDLDGEGLPGVLTEQGNAWYYMRNTSARADDRQSPGTTARLEPAETVPHIPAGNLLTSRRWQFADLAGDGQIDLVSWQPPLAGFYERTDEQDWAPFQPFPSLPNTAWDDANLRFADLTGDGHADLLITEGQALTWHESFGEDGFGAAERVTVPTDERRGPYVLFADPTQSVQLADLSGDGLSDIVRIRNGEVCYWPNLGHGHFGSRVTMGDAPIFDTQDQFDPRRIRLADIDGSGVTDIIYLGRNQTRFWFNHSGNTWSLPHDLPSFPPADNAATVTATDLLGNGTACLVWSSPLPAAARAPMKYLPLMAEGKPHLLTGVVNNLGAETRIRYAPSTYFYLKDKEAGRPWITRLQFPVHVVERVETYDRISRNRFVTRYAYHHGYFDGIEREFRGFAMVEQWDTEQIAALCDSDAFPAGDNIDDASYVPPVHTKTWFHTGIYARRDHVSDFFAGLLGPDDPGEYYREPGLTGAQARDLLLPDTMLPTGLTAEEEREACRALKGSMLRQEVYAEDGSLKAAHPYVVTEQNFTVRILQPSDGNRHGVFLTFPREALTYYYERTLSDPRIAHTLTLEVDGFGNVLKQAAISYGRRHPDLDLPAQQDRDTQTRTLVTYTENQVTNHIDTAACYRAPLPCETCTYELTGHAPTGPAGRYQPTDLVMPDPADATRLRHAFISETAYEDEPKTGPQGRLIEHVRTLYRPDDLGVAHSDPLQLMPLGELQSCALPGESFKLAFTPGLLRAVYQRPVGTGQAENLLPDPAAVLGGQGSGRGGYVCSQDLEAAGIFPATDTDGRWWIPTGRVFYSPHITDTAAQELAYARGHFFLPQRYRDPFAQTTTVTFDTYDLLLQETADAVGNRLTVGERLPSGGLDADKPGNDYRVLEPCLVMDPNRNRTAVAFDALGMVTGTALMGKPEETLGDSLDGFDSDLEEADVEHFLNHPQTGPPTILRHATTRLVYDLFAYHRTRDRRNPQPAVVCSLARETHDTEPGGPQTKVQHAFSYSDGFGRQIQKRVQAEPGPVPELDACGQIIFGTEGQSQLTGDNAPQRWVASGWTVFNNKGKPIRQYEPFFTDTHHFEFAVRAGVSPVLFYDPIGRVIATLHPDHSYDKIVFTPWWQATWDVNDTAAEHGTQTGDPRTDPDIKGYVAGYFDAHPGWRTWYQQRQDPDTDANEKDAAAKAAAHAGTPTETHLDSLGRAFLTLAHNGFVPDPIEPPEQTRARRAARIDHVHRDAHGAVTHVGGTSRDGLDWGLIVAEAAACIEAKTWTFHVDTEGQRLPLRACESPEGRVFLSTSAGGMSPNYLDALPDMPEPLAAREPPPPPVQFATRIELDIEGNERSVRDAIQQDGDPLGRIVVRYDYDLLGNRIYQASMDAGQRWTLNDVAGKPVRSWDSRGHTIRTEYDPLRRPLRVFTTGANLSQPDEELLTERLIYGEQHPEHLLRNLRGRLHQHLDQAGAATTEQHDFKGNPTCTSRRLTTEYKHAIGWRAVDAALPPDATACFDPATAETALSTMLEGETFTSETTYDALNHPLTLTTPDHSITRHSYNEAGLLERIDVNLQGATDAHDQPIWQPFVTGIDYNPKGQRTLINYGAGTGLDRTGATTSYTYDPFSFRLTGVITSRDPDRFPGDCSTPPCYHWPGCKIQNLHYTYDPVGNITHIRDHAQQAIFFRNKYVEPSSEYTYDPVYRLIKATGREHLGQIGGAPIPHSHDDAPRVGITWSANDGNAMATYTETYIYDGVGNIRNLIHSGSDPQRAGWQRIFSYDEPSLLEPDTKPSNRLSSTRPNVGTPPAETYSHDAHGNMIRIPYLGDGSAEPNLHWNHQDQLRRADLGGGGTAYFTYDATGQRVRKVWEKSPNLTEERIYLGNYEIFRCHNGQPDPRLERQTLHIMNGKQRIALVETRTVDRDGTDRAPQKLTRYQFGDHLDSVRLELDDDGRVISYEEYTPYGNTSYQAVGEGIEVPKRYRYTSKERDQETGLYYHGGRYYTPWLGRWISCDPAGLTGGQNLFLYANAAPSNLGDSSGTQADSPAWRVGLRTGYWYGFRDKSGIAVDDKNVEFRTASGKAFLTIRRETAEKLLVGAGEKLSGSRRKASSSEEFRSFLVKEYYERFSAGNPLAANEIGSGKFRFELSTQHLNDSVLNSLKYALGTYKAQEMECYGTTVLNALKASGFVPPDITRQQFQSQYENKLTGLPEPARWHLFRGGGGGSDELRQTLQQLVKIFAKEEWAKVTGMAQATVVVESVQSMNRSHESQDEFEARIQKEVAQGEVVFIGVPGHYKLRVNPDPLFPWQRDDDPFGIWEVFYMSRPVKFGAIIKTTSKQR